MNTAAHAATFEKGQAVCDNLNFLRTWFTELCSQLPINLKYESQQDFCLDLVLNPNQGIHIRMFLRLIIKTPLQQISLANQYKLEQVQNEMINGNADVRWDWHLEKHPAPGGRLITNICVTWNRQINKLSEEIDLMRADLIPRALGVNEATDCWKKLIYKEPAVILTNTEELKKTIKKIDVLVKDAGIATYDDDLAAFKRELLNFFGLPPKTDCWD